MVLVRSDATAFTWRTSGTLASTMPSIDVVNVPSEDKAFNTYALKLQYYYNYE